METDDLAKLMPRMRALNARAGVDLSRLREYMATQNDQEVTLSQSSSVVVRDDVRKDADGFEDIDDFWAEDDGSADKDDTEGEDSSLLSEGILSTGKLSTDALDSSLSGIHGATDESDTEQMQETMELDSYTGTSLRGYDNEPVKKRAEVSTKPSKKSKDQPAAPSKDTQRRQEFDQRQEYDAPPSPDFGGDVDMSFEEPTTPVAAKKASRTTSTYRATSVKSTPPNIGGKADQKKKPRRDSRDSFGADVGGFDNVGSPFSIHDAALTPLSNASEKNLRSIDPFSETGSSDSPNIRVALFKSKKDDDTWDGDHITKRSKKPKAAPKKKDLSTPKKKKTRTTKYKSSPTSDFSFDGGEQTDNDDGSFLDKSGFATDDNESEYEGNRSFNTSRANDLSFADDVLKDLGKGGNHDGVRRSNRKRYKPLAWYKGEHYVYERRQSGVGLVIPTVAAIERLGTKTPQKKPRLNTKPRVASRSKNQKPFPKDKLPKEFKYEDGEWADLWDTSVGTMNKMNVICRAQEIEHRDLPAVDGKEPGYAGQSFNLRNGSPSSRWISGRLGLPPGSAKEAESVGDAVQVFFVMGGQPQSLEVALGPAYDGLFDPKTATRFVLNPNDEFYIPAKNAYYLKNYSETSTCELHFMILKPDAKTPRTPSDER